MKSFIREIKPHANLYRDSDSGIAWIEDGRSGLGFSVHASIDSTGSVIGMKNAGHWRKDARTIKANGFIYNIDTFVCDKSNEFEMIVADECMCAACVERRNKQKKNHSWKNHYRNEAGSLVRDICYPMIDELETYEVIFDFDGERYYCYIDALNVNEALGIFFVNHENITYSHVVDHFEI